jgi:hypothetical protein
MTDESNTCEVCGEEAEWIDAHHVDYVEDITVDACRECHWEIHHTDKHPDLTPPDEQVEDYYGVDGVVDKSKIPSRPGWTIQIKKVLCGKDNCPNCPHGPFYYYYKRIGDDIRCEYGGKVTDAMFISQTRLAEFSD